MTEGPTVFAEGRAARQSATADKAFSSPRVEETPSTTDNHTTSGRQGWHGLVQPFVGFVANVTVITALLVYFGWRRSETQAELLGIDESILGMSTREYVLRSVGSVLALLVAIAVAGLLWLAVQQRLTPLLVSGAISDRSERNRRATVALHLLRFAWILLPGLVIILGYRWKSLAFVLFPATIGVGVLLWLYSRHVTHLARGAAGGNDSHLTVIFTGLLVLVCCFWTASNYAELLGRQLAAGLVQRVGALPGVAVYSERRLHLTGPAVSETRLGSADQLTYRYSGLRLLDHTGGKYFLVSEGWSPNFGVVFVLGAEDDSLRFEFIHDDPRK